MGATVRMMACAVLLASARVASAEGNDPTAAQELFASGKADAKAEDYRAAVAKFSKSYRLDPKPGTLRNVAYCEEQLGRLASALRHYRELIEKFPAALEHAKFASERAVELEKRVPRLTITLAADVPEAAKMTLDGDDVSASDVGKPLAVDPGEHVVEVTAPGHEAARYVVRVVEGEKREQQVELRPLASARSSTPRQPREPRASESESSRTRKTAAYVSLGVGGAALAAFAIHEAAWASKCPDQKCDPAEVDIGARRAVSFVLFGVGIAGAGVGAYLLLSGSSKEWESAMVVRPAFAPGAASLSVARRF